MISPMKILLTTLSHSDACLHEKDPMLVFRNLNILKQILFFLGEYAGSGSGQLAQDARRTLLHIGLASKFFVEPAMDALWKDLDSVFPVFKLLPKLDSDFCVSRQMLQARFQLILKVASRYSMPRRFSDTRQIC